MRQDERHHTLDDVVVVLDGQGHRLTSFKVPHSREGLRELVERCSARRVGRGRGTVHFAFEATGHVWEAVGAFFEQRALRYHVVNPLATFRVREARQMGRDKRDLTDAEQIAQLLRTGVVTKCQLLPARYMQLRRAWGEYQRLRCERARLKTLLVHQLYGVFPEIVGEWKTVTAPGCLAVLRAGLPPQDIAMLTKPAFIRVVQEHRRGRRMWRFKIEQVWEKAGRTVAALHGHEAAMREVTRLVERLDFGGDQLDRVAGELQTDLEGFEEPTYLATLPGIGWVTIAGLLAEIGPFHRFRHGRQLVKLAGLQPSRRESGQHAGRTPISKRGRAQLRAVVYMATLSSIRHNRRLRAHYERLTQRVTRPLPPMQAIGACMTKLLHDAFAVVHNQTAFDVNLIGACMTKLLHSARLAFGRRAPRSATGSGTERDIGRRPGLSTEERARLKELEREVRELRRANEILRKASAFFAQAELDRRPRSIDAHRGTYGVEPICEVLPIAPATYFRHKTEQAHARSASAMTG